MRFVLLDRIDSMEPGRQARGTKTIAPDEEYFRDHFPGYPVVPGVLVLESLAQLGGRLVQASVREASGREVLPLLAKVDHAKFRRAVRPGDRLLLSADVVAIGEDAARVTAVAEVAGRPVASAEIMYALLAFAEGVAGIGAGEIAALREWSDRVSRELRQGDGQDRTDR